MIINIDLQAKQQVCDDVMSKQENKIIILGLRSAGGVTSIIYSTPGHHAGIDTILLTLHPPLCDLLHPCPCHCPFLCSHWSYHYFCAHPLQSCYHSALSLFSCAAQLVYSC